MRTCLAESATPERFWPEFILNAAHTHNILVDDQCISPHEKVHGERYSDDSKLHAQLGAFVITCFQHVTEPANYPRERYQQFTLDPILYAKAIKYMFLDYSVTPQVTTLSLTSTDSTPNLWTALTLP